MNDAGEPNFRVVWSEDQFEYRTGTFRKVTENGIYLGEETGTKYVPKYRQWMPNQYVLERSVPVPESNPELHTKLSYEPLFGFRNLPPDWEVCKFIIDNLYEKMGKKQPVVHMPDELKQTPEAQLARIEKLEKYLFEDESNLQARLRFKEAVVHPGLPS